MQTFMEALLTWGWLYLGIPTLFLLLFSVETE
jgi:hypothetical protein